MCLGTPGRELVAVVDSSSERHLGNWGAFGSLLHTSQSFGEGPELVNALFQDRAIAIGVHHSVLESHPGSVHAPCYPVAERNGDLLNVRQLRRNFVRQRRSYRSSNMTDWSLTTATYAS